MRTRPALAAADVKSIAAAAEAEATHNGWAVKISACDDGCHLLWLRRVDGASPMSAAVALEKARPCVLARRATKVSEDMVNNGRFAALKMPVAPLEGGEMIVVDGEVVGAVGVSCVKAG
ncbi:MAG: heme-binding protein [Gammaproteobacteria bacterium]|nr:heme-binding protein [Gammaproteobacteria bacterium]